MEIEELRDRIQQWKARTQGAAVMDGEPPEGEAVGLPEGGDVPDAGEAEVPVDVGLDSEEPQDYAVEESVDASPLPPGATPAPIEASPAPPEASPMPPEASQEPDGDEDFVVESSAPAQETGQPDDTMDIDIDDGPADALAAAERLGVDIAPPEGESTSEIEVPVDAADIEPKDQ